MRMRLLSLVKYVAIYLGLKEIVEFLAFQFYVTSNIDTINNMLDVSGIIAVLFLVLILRIEKVDVVRNAPNRKSKLKMILLILFTLGIVLYVYRKRRGYY